MNLLHLPWLELAIAITLLGSPCVSRVRNPERAHRWSVAIIGASFGCTVMAWLAFYVGTPPASLARTAFSPPFSAGKSSRHGRTECPNLTNGRGSCTFLTALSTSRTFMRRYSFSWSMAAKTVLLLLFSCTEPSILITLLSISTAAPYHRSS